MMANDVTIRLAEQKDLRIILEIFMQRKDEIIGKEEIVEKHEVGNTLHQSIHHGLMVMGYWGQSIPIGYCVGVLGKKFWNSTRFVELASIYIFEDFRGEIEAKNMFRFWYRKAKSHGKVVIPKREKLTKALL